MLEPSREIRISAHVSARQATEPGLGHVFRPACEAELSSCRLVSLSLVNTFLTALSTWLLFPTPDLWRDVSKAGSIRTPYSYTNTWTCSETEHQLDRTRALLDRCGVHKGSIVKKWRDGGERKMHKKVQNKMCNKALRQDRDTRTGSCRCKQRAGETDEVTAKRQKRRTRNLIVGGKS
jgi:hypothetical protein